MKVIVLPAMTGSPVVSRPDVLWRVSGSSVRPSGRVSVIVASQASAVLAAVCDSATV